MAVVALSQACRSAEQALPTARPEQAGAALGARDRSAESTTGGATAEPKRGGTLISAVTAEPATLDPHLGFPGPWTSLLYDRLVLFDREHRVQPALAESWKVEDDGATLTFTLRRDVRFHNGREVVAEDVKYSLERLKQPKSVFAADFVAIQGIEVLDRASVRLSFGRPFPGVFRMLAQFKGGEIVAREAVEQHGDLARNAMGTGPFMLERWTPGSEILLKRSPHYYKSGFPYLDGISFRIIPDEAGIVAAIRTGAVQHMPIGDFPNVRLLEAEPSVRVYRTARVDGVAALYVNARIGHLADPKVREAIYWCFDREAAVKIASGGLGVATGPMSPTVTDWALPEAEMKASWRRDLPRARRAVEEARSSGRYPDGIKTEVWTAANTRWRLDVAQILSANCAEIGIQCDVVMMEPGVLQRRFLNREAPITPNGWGGSAIDPDALHRFLHSKGQDYPGLNDPELDRLLDEGRYTWDPRRRREIYHTVQRTLLERHAGIWLYHLDYFDAAATTVHYTRDLYPPMLLRGLEETWIR